MKAFLIGSLLLAVCLLVQVTIWRIKLPKLQTRGILIIFVCGLFVEVFFSLIGYWLKWKSMLLLDNICQLFQLGFYFISMMLGYVITYSAVEVDSPSLVMVMAIKEAGSNGISFLDFRRLLGNDRLILPRLADLFRDKMIILEGEVITLTPKGRMLGTIFRNYRAFIHAGKGG